MDREFPERSRLRCRVFRRVIGALAIGAAATSVTACSGPAGIDASKDKLESRQQALGIGDVWTMEDAAQWTVVQGTATKGTSSTHTQGSYSLSLKANASVQVKGAAVSKPTGTSFSSLLALDVMVPTQAGSTSWGAVQLTLNAPAEKIYGQYIGQVLLAPPKGQWQTVVFNIPDQYYAPLAAANFTDLNVIIGLNPNGSKGGAYLLDNLRFLPLPSCAGQPDGVWCDDGAACTTGATCQIGVCGTASSAACDQDEAVRSFENTSAWIVTNGTASIMPGTIVEHGAKSLAVVSPYLSTITSVKLNTEQSVSKQIGLWVQIPTSQPSPSWHGDLTLNIKVPELSLDYSASLSLLNVPTGTWAEVTFDLSDNAYRALATHSYSSLAYSITINPPNGQTGPYVFDDLHFQPVSSCSGFLDNTPCEDNNSCTIGERCASGICGTARTCDDGNVCTDDSCNPSSGCVFANNTAPCNDNDMCTTNDHCSAGVCSGTSLLTPPTGLTATAGSGEVSLSWTAGTGATSYNVLRKTSPAAGYEPIANVTELTYLDSSRAIGPTYYYVVTAVAACGESAPSNEAAAAPFSSKTGTFPPGPGACKGSGDAAMDSATVQTAGRSGLAVKPNLVDAVGVKGHGPKLGKPGMDLASKARPASISLQMATNGGKTTITPISAVQLDGELINDPALSDRILVVGRVNGREAFVTTIHDPRVRRPTDGAGPLARIDRGDARGMLSLDLPARLLGSDPLTQMTFEFYAMDDRVPVTTPVRLDALDTLSKGASLLGSATGASIYSVLNTPRATEAPTGGPSNASATKLLESGPTSEKKNLVIIGDGFRAADQADFDNYVKKTILDELFGADRKADHAEGPLWEDMNAFNITRINVESVEKDVTEVASHRDVALVPDAPADGVKLRFTFTALAHTPVINGVAIKDPTGKVINDHSDMTTDPMELWEDGKTAASSDVTGTLNRTTGALELTYKVNKAPTAGAFTISYANVSLSRNTALDYRFSGDWNRCYFDSGPKTEENLKAILDFLSISPTYLIVVLNHVGHGGCGGGGRETLTISEPWTTFGHEAGHMMGGLCDEYDQEHKTYTDGEPSCVNMTINTNRATLKWREFVDPNTPLPTVFDSATMHVAETAGAFEGGASSYAHGVWRPHENGRMSGNVNAYGPVDYNALKTILAEKHEHDFKRTYIGDFDQDGKSDVLTPQREFSRVEPIERHSRVAKMDSDHAAWSLGILRAAR